MATKNTTRGRLYLCPETGATVWGPRGVVRAVRAHQADVRRRPEPGTRPTIYRVVGADCQDARLLAEGVRVHLPATSERVYKAACTRLLNRIQAMYPEAREYEVYRACDAPCAQCGEQG